MRKAGLHFDEREKVIDGLSGGIFPFKTTDTQSNDFKSPEPPTTTPIIEDVSGLPQYETSLRQSKLRPSTSSKKRTQNITSKAIAVEVAHTTRTRTCW